MRIFISSHGDPRPTAMISVFQGRALFKKTKDFDRERLEDASLNALEDTTAATASTVVHSTGAHSNTTGTHGRVSIGVQAGVPSVHLSGTCDLQQVDDEAETRDTGASIGVDAGQQVDGRIGSGSFFQGGELVSMIIIKLFRLTSGSREQHHRYWR